MADHDGFRRTSSRPVSIAGGEFTVGLRGENGRFLSGFAANGKDFVVGESGQRYTIVLKNETALRFEVVMSVDGPAFAGRQDRLARQAFLRIVDPRSSLEVPTASAGLCSAVAAFRLGFGPGSYAATRAHRYRPRTCCVIGRLSVFHERGTNPFAWANMDADARRQANPFPGKFASPP